MRSADERAASEKKQPLIGCTRLKFLDQHSAASLRLCALARPSVLVAKAVEHPLKRLEVLREQRYAVESLQWTHAVTLCHQCKDIFEATLHCQQREMIEPLTNQGFVQFCEERALRMAKIKQPF